MMERHQIPIAKVYVPVKRAKTLEPAKVEILAEDMLENGQTTPISVRAEPASALLRGLSSMASFRLPSRQGRGLFSRRPLPRPGFCARAPGRPSGRSPGSLRG